MPRERNGDGVSESRDTVGLLLHEDENDSDFVVEDITSSDELHHVTRQNLPVQTEAEHGTNHGEEGDNAENYTPSFDCFGTKLTGTARYAIGILLFIAVDVIWVASAAATKYLYDEDKYDKPLFTLYFKTSLFVLYLLGIPLIPSWRMLAQHKIWRPVDDLPGGGDAEDGVSAVEVNGENRQAGHYMGDDDVFADPIPTVPASSNHAMMSPAMSPADSPISSPDLPATAPLLTDVADVQRLSSYGAARNRKHGFVPPPQSIDLPPILAEVDKDGSPYNAEDAARRGSGRASSVSSSTSVRLSALQSAMLSKSTSSHRSSLGPLPSCSATIAPHSTTSDEEGMPMSRCMSLASTTSVTSLRSCLKRSESGTSLVEVPPLPATGSRPSLPLGRFSPMILHRLSEREEDVVEDHPDAGSVIKARQSSKVHFNVAREVRVLPGEEFEDANYARRSYEQAEELRSTAKRNASRMSLRDTAKLALMFVFLWFIANYFYQLAFVKSSVATVNVLSSTSSLFVLILSGILPTDNADRFNLSKLLIVLLCCSGVAMVGYSDSAATANKDSKGIKLDLGVVYSLVGACFYAIYVVLLKRRVRNAERLVVPLFFGFVGLWCLVLFWPLVVVFNYSGVETFQWPQDVVNSTSEYVWPVLAINGIVGTVISEVLWLIGVFLTSPLVGTLALVLVNPLSLLYSILGKGLKVDAMYIAGSLLVTLAFVLVAWSGVKNTDPIGKLFRKCRSVSIRGRKSPTSFQPFRNETS